MAQEYSMDLLVSLSSLQAEMEHDLTKVKRWNQFQESSNARPQTTLAHTASIMLPAIAIVRAEQRHNPTRFDAGIVYEIVALHDLGEMCRSEDGKDVLLSDKSAFTDMDEVASFVESTGTLPIPVRNLFRARFLTQFLAGKDVLTDEQSQFVRCNANQDELALIQLIFDAIEKFDYLLFAYHEFRTQGNSRILVSMLRKSYTRLHKLAVALPGFGREIFNSDIDAFAKSVLAKWETIDLENIPDRFEPKKSSLRQPLSDKESA
ncbi:MAG: hypothetical protein NUV81_00485 [bacterium]|nr:hypothetical protein [bacterium]